MRKIALLLSICTSFATIFPMIQEYIEQFLILTFSMAIPILIGIFISGILHEFMSDKFIEKFIKGKGIGSVIKAAILGIPLPLCSCSVIPTATVLKKKGMSNGATSAFLISTPETGIDSIFLTYRLMDIPMTIIRPIAAFITASLAGVFQIIWNKDTPVVESKFNIKTDSCCDVKGCSSEQRPDIFQRLVSATKYAFNDILDDIAGWMLIGMLLSALIGVLIPTDWEVYLSKDFSRYLILLVGVPLYICASATTPIAAVLMLKGLSPGSALILLMTGPATNLSNLLVLQKVIGKKGVILNIIAIVISAVLLSYLVDGLYSYFNWSTHYKMAQSTEHASDAEKIFGAVMLLLIGRGVYRTHLKNLFSREKKGSCCS